MDELPRPPPRRSPWSPGAVPSAPARSGRCPCAPGRSPGLGKPGGESGETVENWEENNVMFVDDMIFIWYLVDLEENHGEFGEFVD